MDLGESQLHSFIIKVWLEAPSEDANPTAWTGKITHVPGGEEGYVRSFDEMAQFMSSHLNWPSVDTLGPGRVCSWFRRLGKRR